MGFGMFGYGQGYFGQGPMTILVVTPVDGPIHVANLLARTPDADLTAKRTRASGVTAKRPSVDDWEQH